MSRRLGLVFLVLAACGGGGDGALELRTWNLAVPGEAPRALTLPARLALPEQRIIYRLTTTVDLPPALQGHPLTLGLPCFGGLAHLYVNGAEVPPLEAPAWPRYRSVAPQRWLIPVERTADPHVALELAVDHRWVGSARLDAAPRLSAAPGGDALTVGELRWSQLAVTACAAVLGVVGCIFFLLFLVDRRQARQGWLALQSFALLAHPLFWTGATQGLLGSWDAACLFVALPLGLVAAVQLVHAGLGLPRPSRVWWLLPVAGAGLIPLLGSPFRATAWGTLILSALVAVVAAYQVAATLVVRRRRALPPSAWLAAGAWIVLVATFPFGGTPSQLGLAAFTLLQVAALWRDHAESVRRGELAERELASRAAEDVEVKEAEAEAQAEETRADAQLRRLFADLAHELATPASSVLGIAEALEKLAPTPQVARLVKLLEREGARLDRLVSDIRLLATLEDPDRPLELGRHDLAALAVEVCDRAALEDGEPRRIRYLGEAGTIDASVDLLRIDQVLSNLLSNARRYTPREGRIEVKVARIGGEGVRLQVEDSGPGVPEELLAQLGERLLRIDPSRSRETGNHGLGLSIVTVIVKRHRGEIRFLKGSLGGLGIVIDLPAQQLNRE